METAMSNAAQLPTFDLNEPGAQDELYERYADLRSKSRVVHSDRFGGYYMLTRYEDIKAALTQPDLFASGQGVTIPHFGLPIPALPLEADPPEHKAFRALLLPLFRPRQVAKFGEYVEEVTAELIDAFIERGEADLKAELCEVVPSRLTELFLGLQDGEWQRLRSFGPRLLQTSREQLLAENEEVARELMSFFREVLDRKRADPKDDLLSLLVTAEVDGAPLAPDQVLGMAILVGEAGHATTIRSLTSTFLMLGLDMELRQRLIDDPALIPATINEILRLEAPSQMFARTVTRDCEFAGHRFKAGDKVGILFGSGNRDDKVFDRPDEVDLERKPNPHLSFGVGIHRCVGEPLARLEMQVVIEQVLRRLPDYRLKDPDNVEWLPGFRRELATLPVTFSAGARTTG
ncbi:cytochrome P450 [Streptosporangium amethystogenes subsp. fukuiense]|uniref:Cytochrome P450 n=1 Tax=Streptosporangium amethystogenes subsp. fukuiense TaxID=698418 RepID=A0ABW2TAC2_9ACTN